MDRRLIAVVHAYTRLETVPPTCKRRRAVSECTMLVVKRLKCPYSDELHWNSYTFPTICLQSAVVVVVVVVVVEDPECFVCTEPTLWRAVCIRHTCAVCVSCVERAFTSTCFLCRRDWSPSDLCSVPSVYV